MPNNSVPVYRPSKEEQISSNLLLFPARCQGDKKELSQNHLFLPIAR